MCWCYLGPRHVQGASFAVTQVYQGKAPRAEQCRIERERAGVGLWVRGVDAGIAISLAQKAIRMVVHGFKTSFYTSVR